MISTEKFKNTLLRAIRNKNALVMIGAKNTDVVCVEKQNLKDYYVTLEEFERNGGILKQEREIFLKDSKNIYCVVGYIKYYDDTLESWIVSNNSASFPVLNNTVFVKIQCAPIYQ